MTSTAEAFQIKYLSLHGKIEHRSEPSAELALSY